MPEVLRGLFGMWWETDKAGRVILLSRAKSLIVGHRGAEEKLTQVRGAGRSGKRLH